MTDLRPNAPIEGQMSAPPPAAAGGRRATAARWLTHAFVVGLLTAFALLGAAFAVYGDDSPNPCEYENYREPFWVIGAMWAPLVNALLWIATTVAYLIVPKADRAPLRPTRWSIGLGILPIPILLFGSFVLVLSFFDCDH